VSVIQDIIIPHTVVPFDSQQLTQTALLPIVNIKLSHLLPCGSDLLVIYESVLVNSVRH